MALLFTKLHFSTKVTKFNINPWTRRITFLRSRTNKQKGKVHQYHSLTVGLYFHIITVSNGSDGGRLAPSPSHPTLGKGAPGARRLFESDLRPPLRNRCFEGQTCCSSMGLMNVGLSEDVSSGSPRSHPGCGGRSEDELFIEVHNECLIGNVALADNQAA